MKLKKRKNILFVRHFGVISNLGDKLISKATEEYLQEFCQGESVNYRTASFIPYTQFGKSNLVNLIKGFFFGIRQAFKADRIVVIGGNLVIPNNTKFSLCFFYYFILAKVFSVKFSTFGLGVSDSKGKRTWRNKLYQKALAGSDYIGVRDEHSVQALDKILTQREASENVHLSHDCAFLFRKKYFSNTGLNGATAVIPINYFSATCNENVISLSESEYIDFHIKLLTELKGNDLNPFLLCTDNGDVAFAEEINKSLNLKIYSPQEVDTLFQQLDSVDVIAARMHGIIASLLSGNYVLGLNWQHKVKSLSEKECLSFSCVDFDEENITRLIDELMSPHRGRITEENIEQLSDELNEELSKLIHL
ncbi:polysaccharide pyruvyl transferase family protein [Thalassomonas viridans]|uniref:Polysaccharide pyruvyl transferase family protein n=1 Tax=Thalassomonas viridans TaxID=137584 RepID=A0AAE9Z2C5_9GAMM|nr:polysaccharide pyruvyl transferase family protein [Thalassomonas viridans]WDE03932.1 polysaccharide pyruvyl transferase family protein [Thalassomonas viridans]